MAGVIDYSYARPAPIALRERGYVGAMRYLSREPDKNLSIAERDALWAAGIATGLVWETTAGRPLAGFDAGAADAREANRQADTLGFPHHTAIAYAVDFDPAGKLNTIADYFLGCLSVPGRPVGMYGAYAVVEHLATLNLAGRRVECFWQCAGWSGSGAGSGGSIRLDDASTRKVSRHACLYQDIAETRLPGTDHNHVLGLIDHVAFLYHPDQQHQPADAPEEDDVPVELHIWVSAPDSQWFVEHGGQPGHQAMFTALNTDQFVRTMAPPEVEGLNGLKAWIEGSGKPSGIVVDGVVPDWMLSARTLLPRDWPEPNTAPPVVVSLTAEQIAAMTAQIRAGLGDAVADELADRLND